MKRIQRSPPPVAMTIAGSDSGGGAGIQADLKTFDAFGVHGVSAITALTAQNTRGVRAVHMAPRAILRAQIDALFEDFPIGSVKIGMLGTASTVRTVAERLSHRSGVAIVLDPVMIATTGAQLSDARAAQALRTQLLPLATLVTPNIPEAEALTGITLRGVTDFDRAATALLNQGARNVLLKGGHGRGAQVVDRLYGSSGHHEFVHPRLPVQGHGTGCSLAAAIAAGLALGQPLERAVREAGDFVARALREGYAPGHGRVTVLGHARARPQAERSKRLR